MKRVLESPARSCPSLQLDCNLKAETTVIAQELGFEISSEFNAGFSFQIETYVVRIRPGVLPQVYG